MRFTSVKTLLSQSSTGTIPMKKVLVEKTKILGSVEKRAKNVRKNYVLASQVPQKIATRRGNIYFKIK